MATKNKVGIEDPLNKENDKLPKIPRQKAFWYATHDKIFDIVECSEAVAAPRRGQPLLPKTVTSARGQHEYFTRVRGSFAALRKTVVLFRAIEGSMTMKTHRVQIVPERQGCIYLIHAVGTNRYKIGRTLNLPARFSQLKSQSPYPLEVLSKFNTLDAITDELNLHKRLSPSRVHGEWFELDDCYIADFMRTRFFSRTHRSVAIEVSYDWIELCIELNLLAPEMIKTAHRDLGYLAECFLDVALRHDQPRIALFLLYRQIPTDLKRDVPSCPLDYIRGLVQGCLHLFYYLDQEDKGAGVPYIAEEVNP